MGPTTLQEAFALAVQHHEAGRLPQAENLYRQILAQYPKHPGALHHLGVIAHQTGSNAIAANLIRQAIAVHPNYPEAYSNLCTVLTEEDQLAEAIAAGRQAISLNPLAPQGYYILARALKESGELHEAVAAYHEAIRLKPDYLEAHVNLGTVLKDNGQVDEAIAAFRQAMALKPEFHEAHCNLVGALHYHCDSDASTIAEECRRWNRQHAEPLKQLIQPHRNDRNPDRRLRIGYVSPDFRKHVVARNILPLFIRHDHGQFEIICYSQSSHSDAITDQFRQIADGWRNIAGLSDEQVAEQIRQDRIDILVDLALHTANNRLLIFARKPAPVQVTFAGYPGSTGLDAIDYRLSDPYLDPPGMDESIYSERTIRLPDSFWCYEPGGSEPAVNDSPAAHNGFVTFGCLNSFCKTNVPILKLWASTLRATPQSRLLLLAPSTSARQWAAQTLQSEGIDPSRIQFEANRPLPEYLLLYNQIDIVLDSFPYNGHTTSLDALWMGVPVVSLAGQTAVSRAGVSQLTNLGLTELIAHSPEQFVQIATGLASDRDRFSQLRSTLRGRMEQSPLMDAPSLVRNIEAAYRQMWRTWCAGSEARCLS